MKRVFLFIVTNIAVLVLLSIVIFVIERVSACISRRAAWAGCSCSRPCSASAGVDSLALSKWTPSE